MKEEFDMGRVEYKERSWAAPEEYVCADCVKDEFLKDIIKQNLASRRCGYCGKGSREYIAAPVKVIMEPIASALFSHFVCLYIVDPDESNQEELSTTADALRKIPLECNDILLKNVANAFWCDKWIKNSDDFTDTVNSMNYSWEKFVLTVKHRVRFFFSSVDPKYRFSFEKSPIEFLQEIGRIASEQAIIRPLQAGTILYRVRDWPPDKDWCLDEIEKNLSAPPNEKAQSQRMNPAGISYFYLARDRGTALAEVLSKPPCLAAVGSFKVRRKLRILDLCQLPELPSIFDSERHNERKLILFLNDFVNEISKPVHKDETEHIDYVPSQVVCEYFAKVFRTNKNTLIDGLAYPSAIRPDGVNVVLFPPQRSADRFSDLVSLYEAEEIELSNWTEFFNAIR
jgi:DNA-directed RNA polymerase subunit RPC12/RpoP